MSEIQRQVLFTFIYSFLIVIAAQLLLRLWSKLSTHAPSGIPSLILKSSRMPVYYSVLIIGFYLVFQRLLVFPELGKSVGLKFISGVFYSATVLLISYLTYIVFNVFINWYLEKIAPRTETRLDEEFLPLLNRLLKILIFFIAATIILSHFKVNITGFLATAGIASLAVAFAAQETLANLISGFTIMIDKPFRLGDRVQLPSGEIGDVVDIGLRSTKILSFDHNIIVIPNSEVTKAQLVNYSYPTPRFKIRTPLGVAYGSDLKKVKKILQEILSRNPDVLNDPPPQVFFTEFGDSSLNLLIVYWIENYQDKFKIIDEINMEIDRRFASEGVEIPFPQRDIHIIPPEGKNE
ncbi:MAG: mechanosensitive ion channel family protein [Caldiserica bacterium]|nr:mechanosensitive ion channel family protein [Caldisericota bacterium]